MIINKSKLETKPTWKDSDVNRWADFIELYCIKEGSVSPSDIEDIFNDGDFDNTQRRGEETHLENANKQENQINDYFRVIQYRVSECNGYYPFVIDEDNYMQVVDQLTDKHQVYLFLLLCASISFMNQSDLHTFTSDFEKFCKLVMSLLLPAFAKVELFGTSRQAGTFKGNLKERIKTLADLLHVRTTKDFDLSQKYERISGGDNGIDIVYYIPIDKASIIPFGFAQCTCSHDKWVAKQISVSEIDWRNILNPLPPYPYYVFVPFSCHNAGGEFDNVIDIKAILIDRVRIVKLIGMNSDKSFQDCLTEQYQDIDLNSIYES